MSMTSDTGTSTGSTPTTPSTSRAPHILSGRFLWITVGACALVFLGAFESLAVTTAMPAVSLDLHGDRLYALAFAGPLATGVIGMVIAGNWSDRRGPVPPLYTAVAVFVAGLLIAGLAPTMEVLVAGRFAQGLGSGALIVALYVVVARVYPGDLHPAMFAGFAAAWVVPSLIGPTVAGAVTQMWSWHWVFLGVAMLVVPALIMVIPALRGLDRGASSSPAPWALGRIGWSVLAALSILALNILGEMPDVGTALAAVAIAVALVSVRPLLPRGALRAVRGLPSVLLVRGLAAGAFFGAQVYVPYLLTERDGLSPLLAGLALTGGALAWSATAGLQGRWGARLSSITAMRVGAGLVFAGTALSLAAVVFGVGPVLVVIAWIVAGSGMGLLSPRSSALTLAWSTPENQGFNSAAMTVTDSFGSALTLAVTGLLFTGAARLMDPFAAVLLLATAIALAAVVFSARLAPRD